MLYIQIIKSSFLNPHTRTHGIGIILLHMGCIKVDHFIEMYDKPQTFLIVIDKTSVHSLIIYGVAICVRSFEFTTGVYKGSALLSEGPLVRRPISPKAR